jgi:hypothetical protein
LTNGHGLQPQEPGKGGIVAAWTALFIFASSVSLFGLVTSFAVYRRSRALGERETVKRGIERSLSDLDDKIWKLEIDTIDAEEARSTEIWEVIGRLNAMKSDLIGAKQKLIDATQEEWGRTRDEILGSLDQTRRYLRTEGPAMWNA